MALPAPTQQDVQQGQSSIQLAAGQLADCARQLNIANCVKYIQHVHCRLLALPVHAPSNQARHERGQCLDHLNTLLLGLSEHLYEGERVGFDQSTGHVSQSCYLKKTDGQLVWTAPTEPLYLLKPPTAHRPNYGE